MCKPLTIGGTFEADTQTGMTKVHECKQNMNLTARLLIPLLYAMAESSPVITNMSVRDREIQNVGSNFRKLRRENLSGMVITGLDSLENASWLDCQRPGPRYLDPIFVACAISHLVVVHECEEESLIQCLGGHQPIPSNVD